MEQLIGKFLEHGLLGLITLIAVWFAIYKDKALTTLNETLVTNLKKHQIDTQALNDKHQNEMSTLEERYIAKSESWMQQYYNLSQSQNELLTVMERRQNQ